MDIRGLLSDAWEQGEPYRASLGGLLYGDTKPLMGLLNSPATISPDDMYNAALMFAPITPAGKASLIKALQNGGKTEGFELGILTAGQQNRLAKLIGKDVPNSIYASPTAVNHIYKSRIAGDGFSPQEVAKFAEQALLPKSLFSYGNASNRAELVNSGLRDTLTGRVYDARMPMDVTGDALEAVTVIPKGLGGRKTKPTR